MGIIYKYTSPSGKSYIGQTVRTLKERAGKDGKNYKECTAFWNAIQKYGFENFQVEILEECKNNLLNEREKYYISFYKTRVPFGYNIGEGGEKRYDVSKKVVQWNLNKEVVKIFSSLTEAAESVKCNIASISEACYGRKNTIKNFYWSFENEIPSFKKQCKKKVFQFDEEGYLINEFESARNADNFLHVPKGTVKQCANKKQRRKRVKGYILTYEPFIDIKYYNPKFL